MFWLPLPAEMFCCSSTRYPTLCCTLCASRNEFKQDGAFGQNNLRRFNSITSHIFRTHTTQQSQQPRWTYAVTGDFPGFRPPTGVTSKVDSGSHTGSRKKLAGSTKSSGGRAGTNKSRSTAVRTPGEESAATAISWNGGSDGGVGGAGGGGGVDFGGAINGGGGSRLQSPAGAGFR